MENIDREKIHRMLGRLASEVKSQVVSQYPDYAPYHVTANMAFLDDSPAIKVSCEIRMMVGREPNNWTRTYFIREFHDEALEFMLYDVGCSIVNDLGMMKILTNRAKRKQMEEAGVDNEES